MTAVNNIILEKLFRYLGIFLIIISFAQVFTFYSKEYLRAEGTVVDLIYVNSVGNGAFEGGIFPKISFMREGKVAAFAVTGRTAIESLEQSILLPKFEVGDKINILYEQKPKYHYFNTPAFSTPTNLEIVKIDSILLMYFEAFITFIFGISIISVRQLISNTRPYEKK